MIKRDILSLLLSHLKEKEITLITGPRQVGKTFLMNLMEKHLKAEGEPTMYLNLDIDDDKPAFASQGNLLARIKLELGKFGGYVFIDEIQRKPDAGLFLKGLYDMDLPYKFIVSGSGSLELKEKIQESLAGRKRIFVVDPITFNEFVNHKTGYKYESKIHDFFTVEKEATRRLLEEYLVFGGYPRVVLAETAAKKAEEMRDIYESYIERDIRSLLEVEKPQALTDLLKIIASQIGSLVNVTELASTTGISHKTVNSYLWYLEKTYILHKVTPFYRNVRKEITKAPVYYFCDQGMRNYLLGLFGLTSLPSVLSGHLFENVVFNLLRQAAASRAQIHFWRTRDNAEVDFVLQIGLSLIPIEAKYKVMEKPEISRSFKSFLSRYTPKQAFFVHLGRKLKERQGLSEVTFLPFYDLQENLFR